MVNKQYTVSKNKNLNVYQIDGT